MRLRPGRCRHDRRSLASRTIGNENRDRQDGERDHHGEVFFHEAEFQNVRIETMVRGSDGRMRPAGEMPDTPLSSKQRQHQDVLSQNRRLPFD